MFFDPEFEKIVRSEPSVKPSETEAQAKTSSFNQNQYIQQNDKAQDAINKRPSEPYQEEPLFRYFMAEGWSYEAAIKLARGMIERGSFLPAHEQVKYLGYAMQMAA